MGKQGMAGSLQIAAPAGERLDSWKEISAYLKRDPRTLQRWEKKEGLPVHRHVHESQVSVYAFTSELDTWLAGRRLPNGSGAQAATRRFLGGRYFWMVLTVVAVAAGFGAFAIVGRATHPAPPVTRAYRQVWAADEVDYGNAVSPDGRFVSFTDFRTGDLGVRDLRTGQNRRVTNKGKTMQESIAWTWSSVFAPDGKSIAYSWSNEDRSNEIRIVGLDGHHQRTLLKDTSRTAYDLMDWCPDGRSIAAVIERGTESDLAVISVRDGSLRVLKRFGASAPSRVAFSRDGRYLAYDGLAGPNRTGDVFLMSSEGAGDHALIQYPTDEFLVGWSPRGGDLIFGSDRTGTNGIWRIAFRQGHIQGEPELLKDDVGHVIPLSVTRSGSIFSLLDVGLADIFLTELGSKNPPVRISQRFVGTRTFPSFSPDGSGILYQARRGPGDAGLYVRTLGSGQERVIHPQLQSFFQPRWIDQGRAIDVLGNDGKTFGTWLVDPRTGDTRLREAGPPKRAYTPPDGLPGPGLQISAPDNSGMLLAVRNSPKGYNSLRIVPRDGVPRELVRLKEPERFTGAFAWSPDSRFVFFTRTNGSQSELFRVPATGGIIESTGLRMRSIVFLSIHPDGKRIAFQSGNPDLELWALDGFLPQ